MHPHALFAVLVIATFAFAPAARAAEAIFAGGCFWCMEPPFDKTEGVISTTSGFSGGDKADPTYREVSAGGTGHYEVVRVEYDPAKVSYAKLLEVFWHNIDPLDGRGQFCDKGDQYRAAIFYGSEEEQRLAEASRATIEAEKRFAKPIVTQILPAKSFYPAEAYHQGFYVNHPLKYRFYRYNCGRDARLDKVWGSDRPFSGP